METITNEQHEELINMVGDKFKLEVLNNPVRMIVRDKDGNTLHVFPDANTMYIENCGHHMTHDKLELVEKMARYLDMERVQARCEYDQDALNLFNERDDYDRDCDWDNVMYVKYLV